MPFEIAAREAAAGGTPETRRNRRDAKFTEERVFVSKYSELGDLCGEGALAVLVATQQPRSLRQDTIT
jgi:hypothetical protein